jgi:hypothetical protein
VASFTAGPVFQSLSPSSNGYIASGNVPIAWAAASSRLAYVTLSCDQYSTLPLSATLLPPSGFYVAPNLPNGIYIILLTGFTHSGIILGYATIRFFVITPMYVTSAFGPTPLAAEAPVIITAPGDNVVLYGRTWVQLAWTAIGVNQTSVRVFRNDGADVFDSNAMYFGAHNFTGLGFGVHKFTVEVYCGVKLVSSVKISCAIARSDGNFLNIYHVLYSVPFFPLSFISSRCRFAQSGRPAFILLQPNILPFSCQVCHISRKRNFHQHQHAIIPAPVP